ncbi:MAG: hypothetical protein JWN88_468 [Frankiales bacterium]|nr:hypothetical protein [Frankiales bacterium]
MIGWYVHDHGSGHAQRLAAVTPHLRTPVTVLSSLAPRPDVPGDWLQLADDLPTGHDTDVSAGGTLHWAPRHHRGLLERGAEIAGWVARARPSLVVVDVSVEVAVLVRSLGVPVVVAAMRGQRTDRAHATAYDLASALLAPWPASLPEPWPSSWLDKTWHVGALSRLDGRPSRPAPGGRRVVVLWGQGGGEVSLSEVRAAERATPGWSWDVIGLPGGLWVADPWPLLQAADVVVTSAGQNALAEVAAARRPAVVLPQERPYDEQRANAAALSRAGLAVVRQAWPAPEQWSAVLDEASALDGERWAQWSDGRGAERAAALLDEAALDGSAPDVGRQEVACAPR